MPLDKSIKKVMVIGSGPIVIGQAAEFDYAGAQACRVLKDEGLDVVLVNSNPATIMTDKNLADEIYLEPLNVETIERVLEKERPDGLLAGLGGQTGLTVAMQLSKRGTLDRLGVKLLGTEVSGINKAEDRELFRETMESIGLPCIPSDIANTVEEALAVAERIGYPVIVRPAFTLGGTGGGIAADAEELRDIAGTGLDMSPITQVLVEKCISGWKEIEFETMRDSTGASVIVCSMENIDPVGVHTGDSIVAAPALTLSDKDLRMLMEASLKIVDAIGIIGGCNCQFALHPETSEYAVIEVNPRVSRSSALASKATGYPIAKITTRLALGYLLSEIRNPETGASLHGFEPAVDYIVLKFPRWPFDKFYGADRRLGTQMKATGEVMAIGDTFEAALMKAVRGAEIGVDTLNGPARDGRPVLERLHDADDLRVFTVYEAIKAGVSLDEIFNITKITPYFLEKIKNIADIEAAAAADLTEDSYVKARKAGFTDAAIKRIAGVTELPFAADGEFTRNYRKKFRIVRTCESVFGVSRPYFYSVTGDADAVCEAEEFKRSGKPVIIVLGSGPIRIGQGIEFDYSSVHCVWTLRRMGYDVVIINNNPETVSTDYDTADRLYFEPLCPEDVMDIIRVEKPEGVVVAFGGQTAIKLTGFLDRQGIRILGTSAEGIDLAEDRIRFDSLLETVGISRPKGMGVGTKEDALRGAAALGYPVLLRPSYVIGGQNMIISHSDSETSAYMDRIAAQGIENTVLMDKYMPGRELEVDVISDGEDVLIPGIMEHIERAGIHSGDSIAVYPPYNLPDDMLARICGISEKLAIALGTKGLVNIQYLIFDGELYVIEVNPRASRTIPYISKVTGVPMVDIAASVMLGGRLRDLGYGTGLYKTPPYFAVKVPVFSFEKLTDANSILGPEMKSTGEVLGIGKTEAEALFKGLLAAGFKLPSGTAPDQRKGILISVAEEDYYEVMNVAKRFSDLGLEIYATEGTGRAIELLGVKVNIVESQNAPGGEDILRLIEKGGIGYIVYTGALKDSTVGDYVKLHRRAMQLAIPCLTSIDTAAALADVIESRFTVRNTELVNICRMREHPGVISFTKMESCGNDYIFIENFNGEVSCPESLCVSFCRDHYGIGADGIVLIEKSSAADVRMRSFNKDGTEGKMAANNIRCVGKYVYDKGLVASRDVTVESSGEIYSLKIQTREGRASSVTVNMGMPSFEPACVPVDLEGPAVLDRPAVFGGKEYRISCVSVGNPHCVIFEQDIDSIDLGNIGPVIENAAIFPDRVNTEFVRVITPSLLRARVWERGNGETLACGTGAAAIVAVATALGICERNKNITVKLPGGELICNMSDNGLLLTGDARKVFEGTFEY
ncbi:MAG: carbamoyl-phosphate synthase large subunit [Clostridia bacterium]|nr:carbamoyl-phosphate synthase large subunit [Clostridia bacterium]